MKDKLLKHQEKFVAGAAAKHKVSAAHAEEIFNEIWEQMKISLYEAPENVRGPLTRSRVAMLGCRESSLSSSG